MTLQQGLAFGLVGLTVAAFIWGRFRYDLVALAALFAGLAIGVIPADAAFEGRVRRNDPDRQPREQGRQGDQIIAEPSPDEGCDRQPHQAEGQTLL